MRVLFASWAWRSHYFPMVPLGWALRAAGHDVRVASQPGFASVITDSGLTPVPVGADIDVGQLLADNMGDRLRKRFAPAKSWPTTVAGLRQAGRLDGAIKGIRHFIQLAEFMIGDLRAFAEDWRPDLIVYEPTTFAAPVVAAAAGIPSVRQLWTADFTGGINELAGELLTPLTSKAGVRDVDLMGTLTLDPCPPQMQVRYDVRRQPIRYVPYNGPAVQPGWLREPPERRRLCVTWGTSIAGLRLEHMFRVPEVLEALSDLDAEVVATLVPDQHAALSSLPPNVRLESVALHLLLPTCEAIVHQGGGGTTMTAMMHGLPQLVVPHLPDQIFNAQQLAGTGAGLIVHGADASPQVLREAITALCGDPAYRDAARRLQAEAMTFPAPLEVAERLPALAAEGARPGQNRRRDAEPSGSTR